MISQLKKWTLGVVGVSFLLCMTPLLPNTLPDDSIAQAAEPLNLNTATAEQLIKHRPYKQKDELVQKKVTPQAP